MALRQEGPFQVIERINDNAYKTNLPSEYNVNVTFNVADLSPYDVGEDLRTNPFEKRGNDATQGLEQVNSSSSTLKDPLQVPSGPITKAQARRIKEALNGLVQDIWVEQNSL